MKGRSMSEREEKFEKMLQGVQEEDAMKKKVVYFTFPLVVLVLICVLFLNNILVVKKLCI